MQKESAISSGPNRKIQKKVDRLRSSKCVDQPSLYPAGHTGKKKRYDSSAKIYSSC